MDESSRQAVPTLQVEERGGIFGGRGTAKDVAPKDKTSRAPVQKENAFKKLQDQVKTLQGAQKEQVDELFSILQDFQSQIIEECYQSMLKELTK